MGHASPQPIVITTSAACTYSSVGGFGESLGWSSARAGRGWTAGDRPSRLHGSHDRAVHAVGDLVRGLDLDLREADPRELALVLGERHRPRDAAGEVAAFGSVLQPELVSGADVAAPE